MYSLVGFVGFVTDRNGRSNSAIYLSNGYASIPTTGFSQDSFLTIAVWAYYIDAVCTDILTIGVNLYVWCSCSMYLHFHDNNGSGVNSIYFPPLTTWVHLGTVLTNGIVTFYVNGAYSSTASYTPGTLSYYGGDIYLAGPARPFVGYLDDLMIFKTPLSSSQMNNVKNYYY